VKGPPSGDPAALQRWCEDVRSRNERERQDRWWHEIALERARRYWDDGTGYGAEVWDQNMPILVIVELPS